jgi:NTP pyrophosphatase (non-canonical NTP hydrolase)
MSIGLRYEIGSRIEFTEDYGKEAVTGDTGVVVEVELDCTGNHEDDLIYVRLDKGPEVAAFAYRMRLMKASEQPAKEDPVLSVLQMIGRTSERVGTRNTDAILKSLMEEVGELATELAIEDGTKNREASPDGVEGEAIDVLVVIVDLLHLRFGKKLYSEEFLKRVQTKLDKWEGK